MASCTLFTLQRRPRGICARGCGRRTWVDDERRVKLCLACPKGVKVCNYQTAIVPTYRWSVLFSGVLFCLNLLKIPPQALPIMYYLWSIWGIYASRNSQNCDIVEPFLLWLKLLRLFVKSVAHRGMRILVNWSKRGTKWVDSCKNFNWYQHWLWAAHFVIDSSKRLGHHATICWNSSYNDCPAQCWLK